MQPDKRFTRVLCCPDNFSTLHSSFFFPSLLSHSAVVARELGLPTIVGVSGGLMKRLKSGMRVQLDAGKGRVTILEQDSEDSESKTD